MFHKLKRDDDQNYRKTNCCNATEAHSTNSTTAYAKGSVKAEVRELTVATASYLLIYQSVVVYGSLRSLSFWQHHQQHQQQHFATVLSNSGSSLH